MVTAGIRSLDMSATRCLGQLEMPDGWECSTNGKYTDSSVNHSALPPTACSASVTELASAIAGSKTLSNLTFSGELAFPGSTLAATVLTSDMTEADLANHGLGAAGAFLLAAFMPRCKKLLVLNVAGNTFCRGSPNGDWREHTRPTNDYSPAGLEQLCRTIRRMRHLTSLTFGGSRPAVSVTIHTTFTAMDFSGTHLGVDGALILACFLPRCSALGSLNLFNTQAILLSTPSEFACLIHVTLLSIEISSHKLVHPIPP